MRILIAGYSYEDSFADNARCALQELGHEVRTLGDVAHARYYSPVRYYARTLATRLRKGVLSGDDRRLLKLAREFRPDLVLSLTREFAPEALAELDAISKPVKVLWWGDPPANARRWAFMDPHWHLVFIKDPAAVEKTRLVRGDVHLLHEAMNPRWHRPLSVQRNGSIVVAGNYYPFRQALVERLIGDGIDMALYGSRVPRWALTEIRARHQARYIVRDEKSRIFGGGLGCLNSFQPAEGNSLNCRAFEIAGAAGLQLIEHRPIIEDCFEPGREVLAFRTYEELLELIERAKRAPGEMRQIREAGAKRAQADHTYQHRMKTMLGHLA